MKGYLRVVLLWAGFLILYTSFLYSEENLISLDLKGADLRDVLRMFAENYNLNIVASKDVSGEVTVNLHQVTPLEALRVILNINGFDYIEEGNMLKVVSLPKTPLQDRVVGPSYIPENLVSRVIVLNNVDASTVLPHIKKLLSPHGYTETFKYRGLDISDRIYIRDLPDNIEKIEKLIRELDKPLPQVLIEAKFIDAQVDITKELGFTWRWEKNLNEFDNAYIGVTSTGLGGSPEATDAFNLIVAGTSGRDHYLEMGLQALAKEGKVNLLSSPTVTTSSGMKANVNVVVEIPYIEVTIEEEEEKTVRKETVKFKEAGVKLEVTPVVRKNGTIEISLHPKVTEVVDYFAYQPEEGVTAYVPVMHTRETTTQVIVKDGETIVIAGLMQTWRRDDKKKIPFLGDIPFLGGLFRQKIKKGLKGNLVVFVTPHIITSEKIAQLTEAYEKGTEENIDLIVDEWIEEGKLYLRKGLFRGSRKKV